MNNFSWSRERLRARLALLVTILGLVMGVHAIVPSHARALTTDCSDDPSQCNDGSGGGGGWDLGGGTGSGGGGDTGSGGDTTGSGGQTGSGDPTGGSGDPTGGPGDPTGGNGDPTGGPGDPTGGNGDTTDSGDPPATTPGPDDSSGPQVDPPSLPDPFDPSWDDPDSPDHYIDGPPAAPMPTIGPCKDQVDYYESLRQSGQLGKAQDIAWGIVSQCLQRAGVDTSARTDTPLPSTTTVARVGQSVGTAARVGLGKAPVVVGNTRRAGHRAVGRRAAGVDSGAAAGRPAPHASQRAAGRHAKHRRKPRHAAPKRHAPARAHH